MKTSQNKRKKSPAVKSTSKSKLKGNKANNKASKKIKKSASHIESDMMLRKGLGLPFDRDSDVGQAELGMKAEMDARSDNHPGFPSKTPTELARQVPMQRVNVGRPGGRHH